MLKLWLYTPNLTSDLALGKVPLKESRWLWTAYSIILTSYLLLEPTQKAVFAEGVDNTSIDLSTQPQLQPQSKLAKNSAIDPESRCLLPSALQANELISPAKTSCDLNSNLVAQASEQRFLSLEETLAIIKNLDFWRNIPGFDPSFPTTIQPSELFAPKPALPGSVQFQTDLPFISPTSPPANPVTPPPNGSPLPLPNVKPEAVAAPDPRYLIPPRELQPDRVSPTFTQIVVNDVPLNHRSQYEITGGAEAGDRRSTNVGVNATGLYVPKIVESVSNNRIYRLDYRSNYSQLRTVAQQRELTTSLIAPETVFGMRQQISFVGDCLPNANGSPKVSATGQKLVCTFVPGLKTDEATIDRKQLLPTRFEVTSEFGEVATPETLAAIKAPGFQAGANGQQLGLDFYFPRVGTAAGNTQAQENKFDRFESSATVPMVSVGRIHQTIFANGTNTAIARTVRGFNYISGDRNTGWIAGIQAATELLPDLEPSLPPGKKGGSTAVERTLILAANNNRTPDNSFTAYYSGIGRGKTPNGKEISSSNYEGIWIGFSPVINRNVVLGDRFFQTTGPERIVLAAGGEGGVESNIQVSALVDRSAFDTSGISNAYVQTYLTRYERDVNNITATTVRERTNYYPHLSATGNVTTQDSVLRYYTGLIVNPNGSSDSTSADKAYLGVDFTKVEPNGLSYNLSAIGYINPDSEYYSKLAGTISKQIALGKNPAYNLNLSAGLNYAIDGAKIFDAVNFRSANSFVNVGARLGLGNVILGTTYFQATGLNNSIGNLLSTNASWKISDGLVVSGYYTPVNDNVTRSPFGASASIRLGGKNSPTLSLGWNRNEVDLGVNSSNAKSGVADNVFSVFLRFDAPPNIFK